MTQRRTVVVGGGPVGSLAALYAALKHNDIVTVCEKSGDPAKDRSSQSRRRRSINLALSHRGLKALGCVSEDLKEAAIGLSTPVRGRMVHGKAGQHSIYQYGEFGETIYSVDRRSLNALLTQTIRDVSEGSSACIQILFDTAVEKIQIVSDSNTVQVQTRDGAVIECDRVIGCDGVNSVVRSSIVDPTAIKCKPKILYKEMQIPARRSLPGDYLHIWPRGAHLFMALPNADGTFTATYFTARDYQMGLDEVLREYRDLLRYIHIDEFVAEWSANPFCTLATVRADRWNVQDKAVIIGDAAHAVLPFFGQGMNSGLEDARLLLGSGGIDMAGFAEGRRADTEALQVLSERNWDDMRYGRGAGCRERLLRRLHTIFPNTIIPLYSMIAFTDIPYSEALHLDRMYTAAYRTIMAALFGTAALLVLCKLCYV